jgi:hypothetical protein
MDECAAIPRSGEAGWARNENADCVTVRADGYADEQICLLLAWTDALRALTGTPSSASDYYKGRMRFTASVAGSLARLAKLDGASRIPSVYGVWLEGHAEPVYIGQTMESQRRIRDLPIGESRHLSNTFPPELWRQVVVVRWHDLLKADLSLMESVTAAMRDLRLPEEAQTEAIGLGLEYRLQSDHQPLFNGKRKKRDGGWAQVKQNKSIGAQVAPRLDPLYERVLGLWSLISKQEVTPAGRSFSFGAVAYPSAIWYSLLRRDQT